MPLMQSIRKNAKLILLFMAAAFVLWIFLELGMNIAGVRTVKPYQQGIIAEVNGTKVNFDIYQNILNELIEKEREKKGDLSDRDMMILQRKAWSEMIFRVRFSDIQRKRKLFVDDNLLNTIIMSVPPPQIMSDSSFWKGDSFDFKKYQQFLQDPASRELVLTYAREIINSYPIELMNMDLSSTIHISKEEVQKELESRLTKFTFKYYMLRYMQYPDTLFKFNEDSLKKYYEKNKEKFKKKGYYKLGYVKIEIKPSKIDTDNIVQDLNEIRDMIINKELSFKEAQSTYSTVTNYRKDSTFVTKKESRKFKILEKYKKGEISKPEIVGDTVFLFKIVAKNKDEIKYRAIAMLITTSYETRADLREKAKSIFEIAKTEGLNKAAESYKLKYQETVEVPSDLPFIPGIGDYIEIRNWVKKAKKGDLGKFWTPEGFYVIEILDKSPDTYQDFEKVKDRVKFMFLKDKKKKFAEEIADKIIKGESYDDKYVRVVDYKEVNFYKQAFGISSPDKVFAVLLNMEPGEMKKMEIPGAVIVLKLENRVPPSQEELSREFDRFYQKYVSEINSKIFNSFQQELRSEEGVKDYRSNLLE